jgi:hypothetical protein
MLRSSLLLREREEEKMVEEEEEKQERPFFPWTLITFGMRFWKSKDSST